MFFCVPAFAQMIEVSDEEDKISEATEVKPVEEESGEESEPAPPPPKENSKEAKEEPSPTVAKKLKTPVEGTMGYPSFLGSAGVNRVISAQTMQAFSFRFGMSGQWSLAEGLFAEKIQEEGAVLDKNQRLIGILAMGFSPFEFLEFHASVASTSNMNTVYPDYTTADSIQLLNIGDPQVGVKFVYAAQPYLFTGLDMNFDFNARPGDARPALKSTAVVPMLLATFDARNLPSSAFPMLLHLNLGGYLISSSAYNRETVEVPIENENGDFYAFNNVKPVFDPVEQFGLDIVQSSQFIMKTAVEAPLPYVTPYLEYHFMTSYGLNTLTPGVRGYPFKDESLAINLAVDIGLYKYGKEDMAFPTPPVHTGDDEEYYANLEKYAFRLAESTLQYEGAEIKRLAPRNVPITPPWNLIFGVSYSFDVRGGGKYRPPPGGVLFGKVRDSESGDIVAGAIISLEPGIVTKYATSELNGEFTTDRLLPGRYAVKVYHPDYKEIKKEVEISDGIITPVVISIEPNFKFGEGRLFARITDVENKGVEAQIEIKSLTNENAKVERVKTDAKLGSAEIMLPSGEYEVAVKMDGQEPIARTVAIERGATTYLSLAAQSGGGVEIQFGGARLLWDRIEPKQPFEFAPDDIHPAAGQELMFKEVAEIIRRNPTILKVDVVAHTDDRGDAEELDKKSELRAQAFVEALIAAGVAPEMLSPKGMGGSTPIASNRTSFGRKMNNRVEIIVSQTGERGREGDATAEGNDGTE
ncbi:MAG: hypothetical protein Kow0090_10070 [Myxococcota bacterium]